jgi:nucleoside-diphosphate-sugar epimerase
MVETVLVNSCSSLARGSFMKLAKLGVNNMLVVDSQPWRKGIHQAMSQLPEGSNIKKDGCDSRDTMEVRFEGAKNVIHFTHDYFAMASSKEAWLLSTAQTAKKMGVEKMVAVAPIEHEMYYTEDDLNDQRRKEAWLKAHDAFPGLTILRPSIVYGDNTYLIKYMQQSVKKGSIPASLKGTGFEFKPVHEDDLAQAIHHSLNCQTTGEFSVTGSESHNLNQILDVLASQQSSSAGNVKSSSGSITEHWNEFWTGVAHDTNMEAFGKFWSGQHDHDMSEPDFHASHNVERVAQSFAKFHSQGAANLDLESPRSYKEVALE